MCICADAAYFHTHINQQLEVFGLTSDPQGESLHSHDIVDIIDGYQGRGYALSTDEELGQ